MDTEFWQALIGLWQAAGPWIQALSGMVQHIYQEAPGAFLGGVVVGALLSRLVGSLLRLGVGLAIVMVALLWMSRGGISV